MKNKSSFVLRRKFDLVVTSKTIADSGACPAGASWAAHRVEGGLPFCDLLTMFENPSWMLWALENHGQLDAIFYVRVAALIARTVLVIYENKYKTDFRPRKAVASALVYTKIPTEENSRAVRAAGAAAGAAEGAAGDAAWAARAAVEAAGAAAGDAVRAARAAARAARAAAWAAGAAGAAGAAACAAEGAGDAQDKKSCKIILHELKRLGAI